MTDKEQKFVDAVSRGVGHEKAAIAAGYSVKSARTLAARLLQKVEVKSALKERQEYYRSISDVKAAEVIGAQKEIAFADIDEALDDRGYFNFAKAKETGATKLIKKISRSINQYGENVAIEFYSRSDALNQLADILGLKQQARANDNDIAKAVKLYQRWCDQEPDATAEQKREWISFMVENSPVLDEAELIKSIKVQEITQTLQ